MGVLDQVSQMKSQGFSEDEIISKLQEQGISPKAINDALNQSQIKSAVSSEYPSPEENSPPQEEYPQNYGEQQYEDYPQEQYQSPSYPPQEEYPQNYGDNYESYNNYSSGGTDTIIEVAQQVFSEKTKELKKQLNELNEFKSLSEVKLSNALERIKRIETTMDKLQMAILDKVGSYGNTLESIKREMSMMQDSFGKALPNIVSNHSTHSSPHPTHTKTKHASKRKTSSKKH